MPMRPMHMIPAIDLRDGRVVRLSQGDYARQTDYADDAVTLAQRYQAAGASVLHVVDLDGARSGEGGNLNTIERIAQALTIPVQTGGGVRSVDDIAKRLDAGATRVVVGSLCVRTPALFTEALARFGADQLVAGLDVLAEDTATGPLWRPRAAGWTEAAESDVHTLLETFCDAGLRHLLCTDISRDGMLAGASTALYDELVARYPQLLIQASGGIGEESDLVAVAATGVAACIVGRALLEGRIALERIRAWSPSA